jgi:hypothetical protein
MRGQLPPKVIPPATLQADLGLQPQARGALPVSARLYANPGARYRLDIFGFPSLLAASWRWENGSWLLVRHDKRQVRTGSGALLGENGLPLDLPDVHATLGFLWGQPLPGFPDSVTGFSADSDGVVRWLHAGQKWEARIDPVTGICRQVRSPTFSIRFSLHRKHGGLVIAEQAEIFSGEESLLILRVRDWIGSPPWRKDPFVMATPDGYERVDGPPP